MRTLTHQHSLTNIFLGTMLPPSSPKPIQLIAKWVRVAHQSNPLSPPHRFHYIVILNHQHRRTARDDWHIPASGAAKSWLSSMFWQALVYGVPDENRAGQMSGQRRGWWWRGSPALTDCKQYISVEGEGDIPGKVFTRPMIKSKWGENSYYVVNSCW